MTTQNHEARTATSPRAEARGLRATLTAGVLALAATAFGAASAEAASRPDYVRVRSISFAGSGCPAGTVYQTVSADYQAFRLHFDSFIAETGPGVSIREKRKNCQVSIDFSAPSGWSYAIASVEYQGYVALGSGTTATQKSSYYFQGQSATASLQSNFYGPRFGDYRIRDTLGITSYVWSPCGLTRALNINAQVLVQGYGRGLITLDQTKGFVAHVYGMQWRRC
jgi:hypothetical protein